MNSSEDRMASVRELSVRDSRWVEMPSLLRTSGGEKVENDCDSGDCLVEW